MRSASPLSRCSACAAACPREALGVARGCPVVAPTCDDCGVCGAVCPTGAVDGVDLQVTSSTVACVYASRSDPAWVSCLAALPLPRVAEHLAQGEALHLVRASCGDCPRRRAAPAVEALLTSATSLAAALGLPADAVQVTTAPARSVPVPLRSPPGGLSRRGLLDLFRFHSSAHPVQAQGGARRAVLDALWHQRAPLAAGARLMFRFHAPAGCDGCSVCVRLCPASALAISEQPGGRTLAFAPDRCVGCGLCVDVCRPPGARLDPVEVPVGGLRAPVPPVEVMALRRRSCRSCGAEFFSSAAAAGEEVCFVCSDPGRDASFEERPY